MKFKIGVMGSAQGPTIENQQNIKRAIAVGHAIAQSDCILVTGACPGLPDEAAYGAYQAGGFVIGVSPAFSKKEHTEHYNSPQDYYNVILYTGMGLMERDIINIRSSDAIIILGGGIGTLNEFTVAYEEGKAIGILSGSEGVADHIEEILQMCDRKKSKNMFFENDPERLVSEIINYLSRNPQPTFEDERILQSEVI
jgi:uncharacterized protein (TIGR00725 family)